MLQAVDLPDLFDVADRGLVPLVKAERVRAWVGPAAGHRVVEPVGPLHVGADGAEHLPLALEQPVGVREDRGLGVLGNE